MADPRTIPNPFTKNTQLKRNARGPKWVAAEGEHTTAQRASPGKTAALQMHQSRNQSHSAPVREVHHEGELSPPPMLTAAIYDPSDLQYLPDTQKRRPTVRSWGSLRPSVRDEPEEDVSPRTSMPSQRMRGEPPVSPLSNEPVAWRDSAVSAVDSNSRELDEKERQESHVTVFPNFPYTIKQTEDKPKKTKPTQGPRKPDGVYHSAKAIYAAGPKGEGQKLWKSYQITRKVKQSRNAISEIPRQPLKNIDIPQGRRPSDALGLSAHPATPAQQPVRPPPSEVRIPPRIALPVNEHIFPRKHSDISNTSNTSYEVPIRIDSSIEQYASRSKPLPAFPSLQPAPKSRKQDSSDTHHLAPSKPPFKPLPLVPYPPLPSTPHPNHSPPSKLKDSKPTHWWRTLADKTSESYIPPTKDAKISRPRPITALQNGRTVNVAPSHGGVGGPGAYGHMSEKARGKQKQSQGPIFQWLEKKRHDSETSFGCVGVEGLAERDGLRPEPLFSGTRGGDREVRDTRFYVPVLEVLDEYRDERGSGSGSGGGKGRYA
ncbi:hypothetical protein HBI56_040460 [Parastagonospora nodorum]|uniref:Uncharacterized protein n=1 Tax=Phaeosphaeria nodorum (strain SN15 / ATCC MYA-4574 / FGSC 10173) TaxID=321614 RepID=A0A7U2HVF4_PHANO|nr:hypothetical protein HBH56_066310 [Parastagonospora nodorum]QRC93330.1 hypothetical protein JI435_035700 [Parastagonospora nodorum SN15]KAH3932670.1 hypothetical protein HBH54_081780 [Parastagonospora nodorum]KAH3987918.1 hypothetical protein HBH51_005250 [Parastagonospora nodorum]KAH4109533.1 hypothetical protein HBH46_026800 [Parastagonospora nodorum]